MDMTRPTHEVLDPVEREAIAASKLTDMAEHVGIEPVAWPAETGSVVTFLQGMGYRADGDYVIDLLNQGTPAVPTVAGKRQWGAWDCWHLMSVLESRRRWTLHPIHMHKLSAIEVLAIEAEVAGSQAFPDLDKFGVEQLVLLLEQTESPAVRHVLRVALIAKLREGGML